MKNVTILDNVLPDIVFRFLHTYISKEPIWNLDMYSNEENYKIAGRVIYQPDRNINLKNTVQSLCVMTYMFIADRIPFLSSDIRRIHIGAKVGPQKDIPHTDGRDEDTYTVLYYLTPDWKKNWGGQTIVGKEKIDYVSNRAVIYPSNIVHGGNSTKTPIFRTYINYVVKKKK